MKTHRRTPHTHRNPNTRAKAESLSNSVTKIEPNPPLVIDCPKCGHTNEINRQTAAFKGGIKCRGCGFWLHVRLTPDLSRYVRGLGVTPSGNDTLDIADQTADLLRGLNLDDLYAVVAEHLEHCGPETASKGFMKLFGKDTPWEADNLHAFLSDRYSDRNPGMQRMNLGNVLRAAMLRRSALNIKEQ